MSWYRRLLWPFGRAGEWPGRPGPTVPGQPVTFHCPACKVPVATAATVCPNCATDLRAC